MTDLEFERSIRIARRWAVVAFIASAVSLILNTVIVWMRMTGKV
jgi:hypothetical protein